MDDLYLRLVRFEAEEEEIHELLCVPEVFEFLADGIEPPFSITRHWVRRSIRDFHRFGGGLWALESPKRHEILGLSQLSGFADGRVQLTYLLHPSIWGRGYATRMAHSVMGRAFATGLVSEIRAGADVANESSIAVLRRLGMIFQNKATYPAGPGEEYAMRSSAFDRARIDILPMWTWNEAVA